MSVSYKRPLSEPLVLYQKLLANAFRYSKYFANFNKRKPWTFRFVSTLWGTDHWCLYYTKLAPIFKTKDNFTRHARGNLKLHHTLGERPATRLGLPRRTPETKNFLTFSDLARGKISLKWKRKFCFWCSALKVSGSWRG